MKIIKLTKGFETLVDDEDFNTLNRYSWTTAINKRSIYAKRSGGAKKRGIFMHRAILGTTSRSIEVDHIDGNGLNNQKSNLRLCSKPENVRNRRLNLNNSSGYKGVRLYKDGRSKPWEARIRYQRKLIHVGQYSTAEEAAVAYNRIAAELFGGFAKLNVIN